MLGEWGGVFLSEEVKQILWVPPGPAHGFYVTSVAAEFRYKWTEYNHTEDEYSLIWNDPLLGIKWPLNKTKPLLSEKDSRTKLSIKNSKIEVVENGI